MADQTFPSAPACTVPSPSALGSVVFTGGWSARCLTMPCTSGWHLPAYKMLSSCASWSPWTARRQHHTNLQHRTNLRDHTRPALAAPSLVLSSTLSLLGELWVESLPFLVVSSFLFWPHHLAHGTSVP